MGPYKSLLIKKKFIKLFLIQSLSNDKIFVLFYVFIYLSDKSNLSLKHFRNLEEY